MFSSSQGPASGSTTGQTWASTIGGTPATDAAVAAPSGAAGVRSPRRVTRGETSRTVNECKAVGAGAPGEPGSLSLALIDWFAFSLKLSSLHDLLTDLQQVFSLPVTSLVPNGRGWFGYKHRVDLGPYGLLAYGGESQQGTIHVELNGKGCALVQDWAGVKAWGERNQVTLTRVDLAHDDFQGEQVSIDHAVRWYREGGFTTGGRPPASDVAGDWLTEGSPKGRTLYIGTREAGKLTRVYEKGKEQGDPLSPWCRVEVEFRNKGRVIPWDVLTRAGEYLAGAYPCLEFLSTVQQRIKTIQKAAAITYDRMVAWVRTAAGKALYVMQHVHGGNAAEVLEKVMRPGVPDRLGPFPFDDLPALVGAT